MDWIVLTVILAFLSLGGITLFYMIARAFSLNNLEKWCKSEYMEILITAIIIVAVIAFIQGMLHVSQLVLDEMYYTTTTSPVLGSDPANAAVLETYNIIGQVKKTYNGVFTSVFWIQTASSITIMGFDRDSSISLIPGVGKLVNMGIDAISGTLSWILKSLGLFIMWMYFFAEVIKFGDYLAVFLLPTGIILRAFPPTRGAGAMFVAMGLGLAIVLPSAFLMTLFVSGSSSQTLEVFLPESFDEYNQMLEDICIGNNPATSSMIKNMALSTDYEGLLSMWQESGFLAMLIKIFLAPVVALIITFTFIRSFAMMLGADLAEIGRGLVKLI